MPLSREQSTCPLSSFPEEVIGQDPAVQQPECENHNDSKHCEPIASISRPPSSLLVENPITSSPRSPLTRLSKSQNIEPPPERILSCSEPDSLLLSKDTKGEASAGRFPFGRQGFAGSSLSTTLEEAAKRTSPHKGAVPLKQRLHRPLPVHRIGCFRMGDSQVALSPSRATDIDDPDAPVAESNALQYHPSSGDDYLTAGCNDAFKSFGKLARGINVGKIIDQYTEETGQLVDILTEQEKLRSQSYAPVKETHAQLVSLWIARHKQQPEDINLGCPDPSSASAASVNRGSSAPALGAMDRRRALADLKMELLSYMHPLSVVNAVSEGIVAGNFAFHCNSPDKEPSTEDLTLLEKSGVLPGRTDRRRWCPGAINDIILPSSPSPQQQVSDRKQLLLRNIQSASRSAYSAAYWMQWQRATTMSVDPVSPTLDPEPPPSSDEAEAIPILIPDWFPIFRSYEIFDFPKNQASEDAFTQLLSTIRALEIHCESPSSQGRWDKEWHEPSPNWRHPTQQKSGG